MKKVISKLLWIYKPYLIICSPFFAIFLWMGGENLYFYTQNVHTRGTILELGSYSTKCSLNNRHRLSHDCTQFHATISLDKYTSIEYGTPSSEVRNIFRLEGQNRGISEIPYSIGSIIPLVVDERVIHRGNILNGEDGIRTENSIIESIKNSLIILCLIFIAPLLIGIFVTLFYLLMICIHSIKRAIKKI